MVRSKEKVFEIFSGTGGVGKTTLATSRAIELAQMGKRVLLITIDPAKRLKELLNLNEESVGKVCHVPDPFHENSNLSLYVELMSATATFERIAINSNCEEVLENRILQVLTKPYGGLNEILAIVELNLQLQSNKYDTIVLDTPPGGHFLDFLESIDRIKVFFDQSFIDIFNFLGKKVETSNSLNLGKRVLNNVVGSGVKKLLKYLSKVTGEKFVNDFIDAVGAIYKTKSTFLEAIKLQEKLKDENYSNWYLVTSVEQNKLREALDIKEHAQGLISKESTVLLNKCIENNLNEWLPLENTSEENLKASLLKREREIKIDLKKHFNNIIEFPEVFNISPLEHVKGLTQTWKHS